MFGSWKKAFGNQKLAEITHEDLRTLTDAIVEQVLRLPLFILKISLEGRRNVNFTIYNRHCAIRFPTQPHPQHGRPDPRARSNPQQALLHSIIIDAQPGFRTVIVTTKHLHSLSGWFVE